MGGDSMLDKLIESAKEPSEKQLLQDIFTLMTQVAEIEKKNSELQLKQIELLGEIIKLIQGSNELVEQKMKAIAIDTIFKFVRKEPISGGR